jgi:ribosomal subunit interface protein
MNYNIKGTGLGVTDELRSYVEKKLAAADKFASGDSSALADVELEYKESERGPKYRAEINFTARRAMRRVEARGSGMHEAIDVAVGELVDELSRDKEKRIHLVRRGAGRVKDMLRGLRNKF